MTFSAKSSEHKILKPGALSSGFAFHDIAQTFDGMVVIEGHSCRVDPREWNDVNGDSV